MQTSTSHSFNKTKNFIFQIEIARQYSTLDWREDLKTLLKKCGNENKQTVFLFCDSQIKDEEFVEDINMLLNTGDVPNLFTGEEKAEILEKMTGVMQSLVIVEKSDNFSEPVKQSNANLNRILFF